MIDSVSFIHVPLRIKRIALALLVLVLLTSISMTAFYVLADNPKDPKYADWILVSMSVAQIALAGFAGALVLFYTEREVGTDVLQAKTSLFLDVQLPDVLSKVSANYGRRNEGSRVIQLGRSDIFGAAYELHCGKDQVKLWVGLNVSRLIVIYWVEAEAEAEIKNFQSQLEQTFQFTFGGAQKVGFSTYFEPAKSPSGRSIISIWSSIKLDQNLLLQPSDRLFWMQDIAMMTESFWRTALRNQVSLSTEEPSPL
jgi:hypothetical protein